MSEVVSGNAPLSAEVLENALIQFTGCIGEAMQDICSYGMTVGETYVPFDPDPDDDCEDDEAACSQVWVRVMDAQVVNLSGDQNSFAGGDGCVTALSLNIEVGVLRCFETMAEGEAPTATQVLVNAMQAMADMQTIYRAAMACEVWEEIQSNSWVPSGPMGGQYGGMWTFAVQTAVPGDCYQD